MATEVKQCIHCVRARSGVVARPFGTSFAGAAVGDVLTADYFSIPLDALGRNHFLLVTSQMTWTLPTGTPDNAVTVKCPTAYRSSTATNILRTKAFSCTVDRRSRALFVDHLARCQIRPRPHVPRTPWTNEAAELYARCDDSSLRSGALSLTK